MRRALGGLIILLILVMGCRAPAEPPALALDATPGKANTTITTASEGETLILNITSPDGIDHAQCEITSEAFPKRLLMRFHTRGLEKLELRYGELTVYLSVSSARGQPLGQSLRGLDGNTSREHLLAPTSPYWLKVRVVSSDPQARPPLPDGAYFEVEPSPDFYKAQPRTFALRWVDFYR
jgi:hypothetical protein